MFGAARGHSVIFLSFKLNKAQLDYTLNAAAAAASSASSDAVAAARPRELKSPLINNYAL